MTKQETALFTIGDKRLYVPVPDRAEALILGLPNSGYERQPNHLRGSWPTRPDILARIGVLSVTSLVSLPSEMDAAHALRAYYTTNGINHCIRVVGSPESHTLAAQGHLATAGNQFSYLHCRNGSNRTGIVALLANLYNYAQVTNTPTSEEQLTGQLTIALAHGFDYDKPVRRAVMESTLTIAMQQGYIAL